MSRLLSRENIKLGIVAVFCLLLAWTGPSIAHGVHAQFAHNADKVDGKHAVGAGASLNNAKGKLVAHGNQGRLPDKFVGKPNQVITTHGSAAWTPNAGFTPSTFDIFTIQTVISSGFVQMPLHAPRSSGSATYGLQKVQICYKGIAGGFITATSVGIQDAATVEPAIAVIDGTDRTSTTRECYTLPVGKRVNFGANVVAQTSGAGTVSLSAVRAFWTRGASGVAPRGAAATGPESGN